MPGGAAGQGPHRGPSGWLRGGLGSFPSPLTPDSVSPMPEAGRCRRLGPQNRIAPSRARSGAEVQTSRPALPPVPTQLRLPALGSATSRPWAGPVRRSAGLGSAQLDQAGPSPPQRLTEPRAPPAPRSAPNGRGREGRGGSARAS